MTIYKSGSAKWQGDLRTGKGRVSSQSGALQDLPYGFNTRFEDRPGTNPEELIGAAHAACFSMALSAQLAAAGITDVTIETSSRIGLDKDEAGFTITTAHLTTHVTGSGEAAKIEQAAKAAEKGCPVSKVLNAKITMDLSIG